MEATGSTCPMNPVSVLCHQCCGMVLLDRIEEHNSVWAPTPGEMFRCPVCGAVYEPSDLYETAGEYLQSLGLVIGANAREPQRVEPFVALGLRLEQGEVMAFPTLLRVLESAGHFVHFVARDADPEFSEALLWVAKRLPVRGIVCTAGAQSLAEVSAVLSADGGARIRVSADGARAAPKVGLLVVDGAVALSGPVDLTREAWTHPPRTAVPVRMIGGLGEIAAAHNRGFALTWWSLGDWRGAIHMGLPF